MASADKGPGESGPHVRTSLQDPAGIADTIRAIRRAKCQVRCVNIAETQALSRATEVQRMFDRLLLALDDSPAGEVATLFVGAVARRTGASVHVLHINEYLVGGNNLTLRTRQESLDLVTQAVRQLAEGGVRAGGSVSVSSYRGVPHQIVATALERSADAIVLGSTRARRLGRVFSGRVRERTTRLTALPVLTAPSPLKVTSPAGVAGWTEGLDQALDSLLS
jgi:nucleotide-binding universal stress UspA family protein